MPRTENVWFSSVVLCKLSTLDGYNLKQMNGEIACGSYERYDGVFDSNKFWNAWNELFGGVRNGKIRKVLHIFF
jgi:hypothetical protein